MSKRLFALIALAAVLALTLTGCSLFGGGDGDGGGDGGDGGGTGTAADSAAITYMADGELFLKQVVGPNTTETTSRPYKAGYTFTGWYADEACTTPFDFDAYFASQEKADVTVYAGFEEIVATAVTIIYMADGGQFEVQPVDDGVTAPTTRIPGKAGHKFTGWYEDEACTQLFDFDAYFAQDEKTSVIVYAGFEVDEDAIIQIIYYVDGNVAHTQNVTAQTSASDADAPHKAGHKFTGWYEDEACTKPFDFGAYFKSSPRNTVSVYAGFDEIADVRLHYSVDGKTVHTQTVAYDTTASDCKDPDKVGYEFIGWFADAACETLFDFESYFAQTDKAAETTVYAGFEEIIEISYYVDGKLTWTQVVSDDTAAAIPNEPGKAGYSFAGWYDKEGDGAKLFDFDAYFASEQKTDVNVYAHFERIAEGAVQISYFADGQPWRTQTVQGGVATPETIPAPTKTGYIFKGWYEDETFETQFDLEAFMAEQESSIAVYARFDAICVKLTYMSQGAEHDAVEVTIESSEPTVAVPTKSGYEFIGWFEDEACEIPFDYQEFFANYFIAGAADVTVYAGFARIATITYLADGASPATQTQTVKRATDAPTAQTPSKPGYDFVGWYLEGEEFDFGAYFEFSTERQDVTLHARFEIKTVYIYYIADPEGDPTGIWQTQRVTIETKHEIPDEPGKSGYTFAGWFEDVGCTKEFDFDAYFEDPDKQSVSVYAGYEKVELTTVITYYADGVWFGEQSVTSVDDPQFNETPVKFAHKFTGWYEDKGCKTKFEYDKFMTSSDRGATKNVYAGFELSVDCYDFDGDGLCDDCAAPVIVYTDNSGLELYDYRIGYISDNAANNSVKLAQAIPGAGDFNLVGADGYVTLDGNTLTADGATPSNTPVLLQYIADSRNGDKIAKTVKVHVLKGYTNVSGDWSNLYDAIMGVSGRTVANVVVQSAMTAPGADSNGYLKRFLFIDYPTSDNSYITQGATYSPQELNLYGNALKLDATNIIKTGKPLFSIEWCERTMNLTDLFVTGDSSVDSRTVDPSVFSGYGEFFLSNGSKGEQDVTPHLNVYHSLIENTGRHIHVEYSEVVIKDSILRNSRDAIVKAGSNYGAPGSTVTIEDSVLANSATAIFNFYSVDSTVNLVGNVQIYNWKNRANPQVLVDVDEADNDDVKDAISDSKYDGYFVKESNDQSSHYLNLVAVYLENNSEIKADSALDIVHQQIRISVTVIIFPIEKDVDVYILDASKAQLGSGTWRDPHATLYDNPSLNYELNFGRS